MPLPHEVGTGPRPPAALVDSLDHSLGAVLHLAGHCPCHRVMAPVPVGTATVVLALAVPRGFRGSVEERAVGKEDTVKIQFPTEGFIREGLVITSKCYVLSTGKETIKARQYNTLC